MEYVLIDLHTGTSRITAAAYWQLTFYELGTGRLWEMSVDSSYRNFSRLGWDRVVLSDNPWGAYTGLKTTRRRTQRGAGVITADSRAQQVWAARDQLEACELAAADQLPPPPVWNTFFTTGEGRAA